MHITKGNGLVKILYLDIETAPNLAYIWRFFKENVGLNQIKDHMYVMSFSAIWGDDPDHRVMYFENRTQNDRAITEQFLKLLDEADIVIGHNVEAFDCATMCGRALVHGLKPPSPYKVVDTWKVAKKEFKFPSNSLAYLSEVLDIPHKKLQHKQFPGFELWAECIAGNEEAWSEMKEYNIWDTLSVRDVYRVMRPWIRGHANLGVFEEGSSLVCPKCGGHHLQRRGFAYTNVGKYQRFVCMDCGGWARSRFTEYPKDLAKNLLVNAR